MLVIRFKGVGKKHQITYRVVVGERRSKLKGRFTEDLGWYNPHTKKSELKKERILHWIGVGAQPSDTIHNLLIKEGVTQGKKIPKHKVKPKSAEAAASVEAAASKPAESAPAAPAA